MATLTEIQRETGEPPTDHAMITQDGPIDNQTTMVVRTVLFRVGVQETGTTLTATTKKAASAECEAAN